MSRLLTEKHRIPELQRTADTLKAHTATLTMRYQYRMRREHEVRIAELLAEIDTIQSKKREVEFDKKAQQYINVPVCDSIPEPTARRVMYAPGSSKVRIDNFVDHVHTNKGKTLVNELMTEMGDATPRINIEHNVFCPKCECEMIIQSSKAIIACEQCGYMASYLDATSSSMSYTDDVEFACFSYKRINHFKCASSDPFTPL